MASNYSLEPKLREAITLLSAHHCCDTMSKVVRILELCIVMEQENEAVHAAGIKAWQDAFRHPGQ